jgi:hypothetical protein
MPILLVFLQIVFVVINFYPSLLLPSFANATCHYYNYRSLTICKNKIKLQYSTTQIWNKIPKENNHIYIYKKNTYSWNHKKKVYLFWNTYPFYFSTLTWNTSWFPKFSNFFQNPTTSKENILSKFFYDTHKRKGSKPHDVPYHTWILLILF